MAPPSGVVPPTRVVLFLIPTGWATAPSSSSPQMEPFLCFSASMVPTGVIHRLGFALVQTVTYTEPLTPAVLSEREPFSKSPLMALLQPYFRLMAPTAQGRKVRSLWPRMDGFTGPRPFTVASLIKFTALRATAPSSE